MLSWFRVCWVAHPTEKPCTQAPAREPEASLGEEQGLESSHDQDAPSGGHTFLLAMATMTVGFVRNSGVELWEERLGGEGLCLAGCSRLCCMGSSHPPPGDAPHPAVPAKGQLLHPSASPCRSSQML